MKALKSIYFYLHAYILSKYMLRFVKAMHSSSVFTVPDESEKEASNLRKMLSTDKRIPKNFLSLSFSSPKKRFGATSENYLRLLGENDKSYHPDSFLSELDDQEQRKFRKFDSQEPEAVNSAIIFTSPVLPVHKIDERPCANNFFVESSNMLPPQSPKPIGNLNPPFQKTKLRPGTSNGLNSPHSTKTPAQIMMQISNLPIKSQDYNHLVQLSNVPAEQEVTSFMKHSNYAEKIPFVKYQIPKKNHALVETQAKSIRLNDINQAKDNKQRRVLANRLKLDKNPKISVFLPKLAENLESQGGATSGGGIGKTDERSKEIKEGKRPIKNFEQQKKKEKIGVFLNNFQPEKSILNLITLENKMLWSKIFQYYMILAKKIPDQEKSKKDVLKVLRRINIEIKNHESKSFHIKNNQIEYFLKCPKLVKFKPAAERIALFDQVTAVKDETKLLHQSSMNLNSIMEKVSFKDVVSEYFMRDGSEVPEWWGKSELRYDRLKKKKFFAKMFFVYSLIINKVFCEEPSQDIFIEEEKKAVEFLNMAFQDAEDGEYGRFFLQNELIIIKQQSDKTNHLEIELNKIIAEFNSIMKSQRSTIEFRQLGMIWKLIELWLAQFRSELYRNLKVKKNLKDNLKPFLNFLLTCLSEYFD
ncbi:expressed protein [Phakopsora pachyrhizi]|uniref:Expressed protein n=1 Tax=Phakopsora pachyrhizi TaxID=170000 RepID=A0AAV0ATE2_PHAPC|nr:expressed protein [Phakopsora pachyrhizi]